jgi:hypothetical protein
MKCKRLSLLLLSLLLVSSQAFCGWGFLKSSSPESEVLTSSVTDYSAQTNESSDLNIEKVKNLEEVNPTLEKAIPTTTTLEEEKIKFLNSQKVNEKGIANLSQNLDELESNSMFLDKKIMEEFRANLMNLSVNLVSSNQTSLSAEELLNDYDEELAMSTKELTRVHYGVGASYLFDSNFESQRIALDLYIRKQNVYINGSVDYPINDFMNFDTKKLSYKVGFGYEF